jgi:hypothetical protein
MINEDVVAMWTMFREAGAKKVQARRVQGDCFERLVSGQMTSMPFEESPTGPSIRLVKISSDNPVFAIRLDRSAVITSRLPHIVVEFIMGSLWTTRGHTFGDFRPVLIDNQLRKLSLRRAGRGGLRRKDDHNFVRGTTFR